MEGMERIRESILAEARTQAEAIIKEAEDKVKEMESQAEKRAEELTKNRFERAEVEAQEAQKRMLSMAELELKKQSLEAKQSIIDQAFDKALVKLNNLPEEKYAAMIVTALGSVGIKGGEELIVPLKDREKFQKGLLKRINDKVGFELKLSDEDRGIQGGFIVKVDGVEINNSFETLLRMEREKVESEIADILFQQ
ncbi:MAG TPA: V-type ATP synthase subunit E family protein [Clostridia bacterium]|nr:V-type ATP synthase subunit E family protein [Clostridia bacterium]